jgi:hypothetical protein
VWRRCQRHRNRAKSLRTQPIGFSISLHGAIEITRLLKQNPQIERGFGIVRFYLDRLAVGRRSAAVIVQILAGEAEIEPDRCRRRTRGCALEEINGDCVFAILPRQSPEPRRGFLMIGNGFQNGPPRLARRKPMTGQIERPGFFEKHLSLWRDRDHPIQMRQRTVKILFCAGDAGGQQMRGGIVGPF